MPRLGPVTRDELVRKFRAAGFDGPFPGTKHAFMTRDGQPSVRIPNTDIDDIVLLMRILRHAATSCKYFMTL